MEDIVTPEPTRGELLVRVSATGLCRTDLKIRSGFLKPAAFPHILGHEVSGQVAQAVPRNEEEERLVKGTKGKNVLVHFYVVCGRCEYCLSNRSNLCALVRRLGFDLPGGFAEYVTVPIRNIVATSLGPDAAVLTDAGATIWHAFKKINLEPGTNVAVMGVGGLGGFAIQVPKLMGANSIALDIDDEKLAFAERLGADTGMNVAGAQAKEVKGKLESWTKGRLADVFVDLVGTEESQKCAVSLLARGGKLLQVGYTEASYRGILIKDVVYDELQVVGSLASTMEDLRELTKFVEAGRVTLDVTDRYELNDINSALEALEHNRIRGRAVVTA